MNQALAVASGEYFAPMDQDDVALPDRLRKLVGFLEQNREIALVGGGMQLIDERGNIGRKKVRPLRPYDVAKAMHTSTAVIHPASMMRASAVSALGGYRSILPFAEDYDLWLRLMERHQIANIADIVLLKRIHSGAVTQDCSHRAAQVVARAIAYLSHLSRVTFGEDMVCAGEPLLVSAARFIDEYLDHCDELEPAVGHNLSRFMRYAPLLTVGQRAVNRPYLRYLAKAARSGDVRQISRTCWYLALYFGCHRWRQDGLSKAFPAGSDAAEATVSAA
jgi:Glycosyl transferase family 2